MSGKLSKQITVHTNAPGADATIQIKMSGETWLPIEVTPKNAGFGRINTEQAAKVSPQKLTVVSNVDQPVQMTEVKSSNPAFKAEIKPLEPGKKFELTVSLQPDSDKPLVKGNLSGTVTLTTGLADMPTLDVPVSVVITADVDVQPDNLTLFNNRTSDQHRPFTVQNYTSTPVKLLDVAATNPLVRITTQETTPGTTFKLDVAVPPTYTPAAGEKITIKTDSPKVPELTIPISERQIPQPGATPQLGTVPGSGATAKPLPAAPTGTASPPTAGAGLGGGGQPGVSIKPVTAPSPPPPAAPAPPAPSGNKPPENTPK